MAELEDKSFDMPLDIEDDISSDTIDILSDDASFEDDFAKRAEEMDLPEEIKSIVDQNVQPLLLPKSNGEWTGEPGNSEFIMDDDYILSGQGVNLEGMTMAEIKEKYGFDGVAYDNKEPDFSPFVDPEIGVVILDSFSDERTGKGGTYDLAREKAAENLGISTDELDNMMKERGLTWHECSDRKTVIPIPTDINAAFKHSGGISIEKGVNVFGQYLHDEYGNLTLERTPPLEGDPKADLNVAALHKEIRSNVKNHRNKPD